MKKTKMDDFVSKVCANIKKKLGDGYRVEVKEVRKNNGVARHGLLISTKSQNVAPTIYLESFWEDYEKGINFMEVINRILAVYQKGMPVEKVAMDFFRSYEKVKDRICYRLIERKGNEGLLKEIPYIEFLDLAICFYYAYQGETLGEGSILIYNSHMGMWDVSAADLLAVARENTPRIFPWECSGMMDILNKLEAMGMGGSGLEMGDGMEEFSQAVPMKVLSNEKRFYGAACILYPGVLEKIAGKGGNLYILPSSVHETILLPYDGKASAEELKEMIHEVNSTQLAPEEVLSDSLYYYDAGRKEIVLG